MKAWADDVSLSRAIGVTTPLLAAVALLAAYESYLPIALGLALTVVGVAAGVWLRVAPWPAWRAVFLVPPLLALAVLAVYTPAGPVPILVVGAAGVTFVAWILDDPFRPPAGASRGAIVWAIPALGFGIAWASTFLLPSSATSFGVAGGLVAAALLALAFLVGRPELFDPEPATTI